VIFASQNESELVDNVLKVEFALENLPSFTNCSATVRAKPDYADESLGFWSDNRTVTFRSQEGGFLLLNYYFILQLSNQCINLRNALIN